jgi:bromodomain-containing factor 1
LQNAKPVTESNTVVKESPKKPSAPKHKKEPVKKEEKKEQKLIPVQLVTPGSTANTVPMHMEQPRSNSEDRRPKRDIHAPSKEIQTGSSAKRKVFKWKTDRQFRHCHSILRELFKKSNAEFMFPFMEPVDIVKLKIPDYPKIVKRPMDVGTIRTKLESDEYENVSHFEADKRLVLRNCYKFNSPDNPVHQMGKRFEALFNEKWTELPPPPTPPPVEEVAIDSDSDDSDDLEYSGMFNSFPR